MKSKINLIAKKECDVFVMGAGIAGIMAAITASQENVQVIIASSTKIFSGSSFYPGTWGLGLIGPEDKNDEDNLAKTIKEIGCDVVNEKIVNTFVKNINPSIKLLKEMEVQLKEADNKGEKEFIPCFDYKERSWNGILFDSAKEKLGEQLKASNIIQYPNSEVIDIIKKDEKIIGVVLINSLNEFEFIKCKSVIIASGGIGGLFKYRLNTSDITGMGQALGLKVGCKLVNMEFMQMMPGYIKPCTKTIFNEKTFKYVDIFTQDGENILKDIDKLEEKLEERSTHGPFTSRLNSKEIDCKIFKEFNKNPKGIKVRYKKELKINQPEFIKVYFDWLKAKKKLTIDDEINLGIFFHAANGGIKINEKAETGVLGLYAAGEVTGGMHGADRIGGLSTANGLVFGIIAGKNASKFSLNNKVNNDNYIEFYPYCIKNADEYIKDLQEIMFKYAMIEKNENGIIEGNKRIEDI